MESQQRQESVSLPAAVPPDLRRPPRLTPGSCRGRGSSPARFASSSPR